MRRLLHAHGNAGPVQGGAVSPTTHRIWIDDDKHNEHEDGEDFDAHSARDAV